jgi:hypothetical protein
VAIIPVSLRRVESAQRFNANRVKTNSSLLLIGSFSVWKNWFSSPPPRMEKQFSFAIPLSIYRVAAPLRAAASKT